MWQLVLAVAIVVFVLLRLLSKKDPPNAPVMYTEFPYVPWLGSIVQFASEPRDFLLRAQRKCGEIFDVQLFGQKMTFLMSQDGHNFFFKQPEEQFNTNAAYKFVTITFGPGVVYDAPPKIMYEQFGFFRYGLDAKKYNSYTYLIQEEAEMYFREQWGNSGRKCIFTALNELFTLTSCRCLMGPEIRAMWKKDYANLYQDLDKSFIPILFFFPNVPHPFAKKCVNARTSFENLFRDVIEQRKKNPNTEYDDFLQVLVESRYKSGAPLTMPEITGVMMGVLLGGQHTSNVTGAWLLMHLLQSPEWLEKCLDEQRKVMGDSASTQFATFDQIQEMTVLQQCLDETLRLHPPFFQLARAVLEDVNYKGTIIPKGRIVAISPGAAMRMEELWDNPLQFDPSRFSEENRPKIKDHAFIAFGGGNHLCIGRKFAYTAIKIAISWLLRAYDFEKLKDLPGSDYTTMVVAPAHSKGESDVTFNKKVPW